MDSKELKTTIEICCKADLPLLIWSDTGAGKSQIVEEMCKKLYPGGTFIDRRLGQMEIGDFIGRTEIEEFQGSRRTVSRPPDWFPITGEGFLFLDEGNRASSREVLQAIFQLIYDRQMYTYKLSPGFRIIMACNPSTNQNDFQVLELDPGFLRRWVQVEYFPTRSSWKDWAKEHIKNPDIINFAHGNFETFKGQLNWTGIPVRPTLAGTEYMDKIYEVVSSREVKCSDRLLKEIVTGIMGVNLSQEAFNAMKNFSEVEIEPEEILHNKPELVEKINKIKDSGNLATLESSINATVDHLKSNYTTLPEDMCTNLTNFLNQLPDDYMFTVISKLSSLKDSLKIPLFQKFTEYPKLVSTLTSFYQPTKKGGGDETTL